MVVDILHEEGHSKKDVAFLKLFDRRFSDSQRRQSGSKPWTKDTEAAYIDFVTRGAIAPFLDNLRQDPYYWENTREDWNTAEREAHLARELLDMFKKEVAAYEVIRKHQGSLVPNLLAAVDLEMEPPESIVVPDCGDFEPFRVKGILLDYIDGCDVFEMVNRFPRTSWQYIVNEALEICRVMNEMDILNTDVSPKNFVVAGAPATAVSSNHGENVKPHVYMIDLAMCRVRRPDEADGEWGYAKYRIENFALGLKRELKKTTISN